RTAETLREEDAYLARLARRTLDEVMLPTDDPWTQPPPGAATGTASGSGIADAGHGLRAGTGAGTGTATDSGADVGQRSGIGRQASATPQRVILDAAGLVRRERPLARRIVRLALRR